MKRSKICLTIVTLLFLSAAFSNPSIGQTVTYPSASGITWLGGVSYIITWSGFPGSNVKIELYVGGGGGLVGQLYKTLTSSTTNDGAYGWTVPLSLAPSGAFSIRITSTSNPTIYDISDNHFTIHEPTIVSPSWTTAPHVIWYIGSTHNIQWYGIYASSVKIELYKGGSLYYIITSSTANDGSYSWTIPTFIPLATDYKIRITSVQSPTIYGTSLSFIIAYPKVLYPSISGITWNYGSTYNVTWSGFTGFSSVKIDLYKGSSLYSNIISSTSNDGAYSWTIPASIPAASDYRIKITSSYKFEEITFSFYDYSDNYFTIGQPAQQKVLYPSASGITWNTGSTPTITWSGFPGSYVKIELYKGSSPYSTVISPTPNDGGYHSWTVPTSVPFGTDYRIKITSTANTAIYDFSDNYFIISSSAAPPTATKTLGNTTVYPNTNSTATNRRAMPVIFPEAGTIRSISIYHNGGTGQVLLGVYSNASGAPSSRLGVTPSTTIRSTAGWQTVALTSPVTVASGQTVWLSWVFQTNPGVHYMESTCSEITCSIAQSAASWSGGMPAAFGAVAATKWNKYSMYCTYTPGGAKSEISSLDILSDKPDNEIVTVDPNQTNGNKEKVSIYPNPTDGSVTVTWDKYYDSRLILTIYNSQGSPVKKVEVEPSINQIQVDLNNNLNGLYLLELRDMNGIIINRSRIVKR